MSTLDLSLEKSLVTRCGWYDVRTGHCDGVCQVLVVVLLAVAAVVPPPGTSVEPVSQLS